MSYAKRFLYASILMLFLSVPLFLLDLLDLPRESLPSWWRFVLSPIYMGSCSLIALYALRGYLAERKEKQQEKEKRGG